MEGYIAVAAADELKPAQMKRVVAQGKRLLLCNSAGTLYCVDEMCSHEDYSLYLGCIKDGKIKCSLHGSYFDLASGQPACEPADEAIRTYPVKVENGQVWINPAGK
ncbi:MAG: non-heme iron oxygenase ferredoxin subunit [Gallionellales bacterium 35-53-114]|nr:MAG: non-heme iron oxygenase ferredoxin subunit [Gallionellales bacterium 35-53-114]OYZ63857.1 MAG: non-heme iron oxygenase ferredoxin subunit [Gallionellales bacterium 24-53-125]OZB09313.1 MAG: non-heme iron oxygenase ferredoxin subunit [Gallionellales bacterium 39-52-133]